MSLTLLSIVPYALQYEFSVVLPLIAFVSAAMTLPLVLRRHAPLLMLALVTLGATWHLLLIPGPSVSLIAIPIVA